MYSIVCIKISRSVSTGWKLHLQGMITVACSLLLAGPLCNHILSCWRWHGKRFTSPLCRPVPDVWLKEVSHYGCSEGKPPIRKGYLSVVYSEEMKWWTAHNHQTVNTQINLLAGVIDGAAALDQYHMVIFIATAVPYIVSHAAKSEMILSTCVSVVSVYIYIFIFFTGINAGARHDYLKMQMHYVTVYSREVVCSL